MLLCWLRRSKRQVLQHTFGGSYVFCVLRSALREAGSMLSHLSSGWLQIHERSVFFSTRYDEIYPVHIFELMRCRHGYFFDSKSPFSSSDTWSRLIDYGIQHPNRTLLFHDVFSSHHIHLLILAFGMSLSSTLQYGCHALGTFIYGPRGQDDNSHCPDKERGQYFLSPFTYPDPAVRLYEVGKVIRGGQREVKDILCLP